MIKEDLELTPYKDLQVTAKDLGLQYVGVSKAVIIENILKETNYSVDDVPEETADPLGDVEVYTPEVTEEPIVEKPKLTTTRNVSEGNRDVIEKMPKVSFKSKTVKIKPRKDTPVSIIGAEKWALKKGKVYEVPIHVAEIFENAGYL